jgi:hypothetical protein
MRKSSRALSKDVVQMVYFMRGAISYNDALLMTPGERDLVTEFVTERLESENKRMYPNY